MKPCEPSASQSAVGGSFLATTSVKYRWPKLSARLLTDSRSSRTSSESVSGREGRASASITDRKYSRTDPPTPIVKASRAAADADLCWRRMTDRMSGKSGIVTGGARGIGRELAAAFAAAGARVAIWDTDGGAARAGATQNGA